MMKQYDEIEARCRTATPAPWSVKKKNGENSIVDADGLAIIEADYEHIDFGKIECFTQIKNNNAEFIAHAREDVPALLREIAVLNFALMGSVKLQGQYAELLNMWDGGRRRVFKYNDEWIAHVESEHQFKLKIAELREENAELRAKLDKETEDL